MKRADTLRIHGISRGLAIVFRFDGQSISAYEGELLTTALLAAGIRRLREGPAGTGARGMFCCMGSCQECLVLIGGRRVEACRTTVAPGLEVSSLS